MQTIISKKLLLLLSYLCFVYLSNNIIYVNIRGHKFVVAPYGRVSSSTASLYWCMLYIYKTHVPNAPNGAQCEGAMRYMSLLLLGSVTPLKESISSYSMPWSLRLLRLLLSCRAPWHRTILSAFCGCTHTGVRFQSKQL